MQKTDLFKDPTKVKLMMSKQLVSFIKLKWTKEIKGKEGRKRGGVSP